MEGSAETCDGYTVNVVMLTGFHNVQDDNNKNISFNNNKLKFSQSNRIFF
jgi:hypothetical protein